MAQLPKTEAKLREFTDQRSTDLGNASRAQGKTGLTDTVSQQQTQINDLGTAVENVASAPVDDNVPPSVPTGVTAFSFQRAIAVNWSLAAAEEYVDTTIVRLTTVETGVQKEYSYRHRDGAAWIDQIDPKQYSVQVRNIDLWGHTSNYSPLILQTAAESTADYIVADKIFAGILRAAVSIQTGGYIASGGARMDAAGLNLQTVASEFEPPATNIASKITPNVSPVFASFQFYDLAAQRGIYMRADGVAAGTKYGAVFLEATGDGVQDGTRSSWISVRGGATSDKTNTFIKMKSPFLQATGAFEFVGEITQAGGPFRVAANGDVFTNHLIPNFYNYEIGVGSNKAVDIAHGLGGLPSWIQCYVNVNGSTTQWRPTETTNNIDVSYITADLVRLTNSTGNAHTFRLVAFR